jgi:RNA polymerase sigma factor (sigma-70 family)
MDNEIYNEYDPLVRRITSRFYKQKPATKLPLTWNDIYSYAREGLWIADRDFNPEKNPNFPVWAGMKIKFNIIDCIRKHHKAAISKLHRELIRDYMAFSEELEKRLRRPHTDGELADFMGITVDRLHELKLLTRQMYENSGKEESSEDPDEVYIQAKHALEICMENLRPEEKLIFLERCLRPQISLRVLGEEGLGLEHPHPEKIKRIYVRAGEKLKDCLKKNGVSEDALENFP